MKSPLGTLATLVSKAPVPYAGRAQSRLPWYRPAGTEGQLRAMGSVGTLFAIVDRLATSTAAPNWRLYRTPRPGQAPEDRQEVTAHLALDILNKPNKFYTRSLFIETGQQHFDLVGETWWVVARNPRMRSIPLELWPVRPDRMEPIPDHDDYLIGYWYCGPDGERVPLGLDEVIQTRRPNPIDPYRGIGPVQTIRADLEGVRMSSEWNRNFFANSAEPGGIIRYDHRLGDEEYNELRDRWQEQHQGVANAHRVAIMEAGEWIERKFTQRDMQFAELRKVGSEVIREAYGIPAFALGEVTDVNRATAEAASVWFAQQMTVPRLERIKQALNSQFLPMFGTTGQGVEFDYDSPVAEDREAERADLTAKATAAQALIDAGAYGPEVLEALGLPEVSFGQPGADPDRELLIDLVKGAPAQLAQIILPLLGIDVPEPEPEPEPAPAPPPPPAGPPALEPAPEEEEDEPAALAVSLFDLRRLALAAATADEDNALAGVRDDLEDALDDLMERWDEDVLPAQIDALTGQIAAAIDDGDLGRLSALTVVTTDAANLLRAALADMAQTAADRMVDEAAAQGVRVTAPDVDPGVSAHADARLLVDFGAELAAIGVATAAMLGADLAAQAGREALRHFTPGAAGSAVASKVRGFLNKLKGATRRSQLGGALHRATNVGRLATLQAAPVATYIATEVNDRNRCKPCEELDGTEFTDLATAWATYATGGYAECLGGVNCRGTIHAVWSTPEGT